MLKKGPIVIYVSEKAKQFVTRSIIILIYKNGTDRLSIPEIADYACYSERHVINVLRALEREGVIRRFDGAERVPYRYEVVENAA